MGWVYAVPVERIVASRAARAEVRVCVSVEEGEVERDAVAVGLEEGGKVLERLREVVGWEWVDVREGGGMGGAMEGATEGAMGAGVSGRLSSVEGVGAVVVVGGVGWRGVEVCGRVAGEGVVWDASIAVGCGGDVSLRPLSSAATMDTSVPSFGASPAVDSGSCWGSLGGGTDSAITFSTPPGAGPTGSLYPLALGQKEGDGVSYAIISSQHAYTRRTR